MIILGLNHGEINSSAALYKNGKILAGAPEERFNRQKKTKTFPRRAIEFCMSYTGITMNDIDFIAQAWNPGAGWQKYNPLLSGTRIRREDYFYSLPDNLLNLTQRKPQDWLLMDFPEGSSLPPIYYVQHHRAHAANAFFLSPFEEAAIMTADWKGEFESMTTSMGCGNSINTLKTQNIPHSLGLFYATYTELLGYRPDNDEWKVMALSAFDVDYETYAKKIRSTLELTNDGGVQLDQSYYKGALQDQPNLYTPKLVELLGGNKGEKGDELKPWNLSVAKAMQEVAEEAATHVLKYLHKRTQCKNLVLGGGFFMNSVYNGRVLNKTPFEHLYLSYCPTDVGNSIGAALYVAHCIKDQSRTFSFNSSFIGPEYSDDEMEAALNRRNITYQKMNKPYNNIADLISQGEVVATFSGRMEFGERALGNRSILADPRHPEIKDKINAIIKYRESYRPFAPAVLHEKAHQYFEVEAGYECHYMEKVKPIRREYWDQLPAITHVDGSGRLQTVKEDYNPHFHKIISAFEEITGFPILLNTSFNINGEPVVCDPDDALSTFFNSGLKYLALGSFLVSKDSSI